jgi:tagatose 6-phosphate kinase
VIVTLTLNPALQVSYAAQQVRLGAANPVSQVSYRAGGSGLAVARVLHTFGHEVVAAGLAGGAAGELIRAVLSTSGIATQFTQIAMESRRVLRVADSSTAAVTTFAEPAPYITTEELGRLAADYRGLLDGATAVVLCGSLPAGLPPETYGSLASYAAEAGVPAVVAASGSALWHAVARRPALAVPWGMAAEPAALVARGAHAAVLASDEVLRVVTAAGGWRAWLPARDEPGGPAGNPGGPGQRDPEPWGGLGRREGPEQRSGPGQRDGLERPGEADWLHDALVAGLVPGIALGWSWPDALRHAVALVAAAQPTGEVDLRRYEARLPEVQVEPPCA